MLADQHCTACTGSTPRLEGQELEDLVRQLPSWAVVEQHHLSKRFEFRDFASALQFVNRIGELAEREGHHPDIHLAWGRVEIQIFTHKINGLSESDFILAARIDRAFAQPDAGV